MTAVRKLVKYYVRPILNNSKNKDSLCLGSSRLYFDKIELITRNGKDISSKYLHLKEITEIPREISKTIKIQLNKITKTRKKIQHIKYNKQSTRRIITDKPEHYTY